MRKLLEDYKTIVVEIIGVIGGYVWATHSRWDDEPVILMITSAVALVISLTLRFVLINEDRPIIDLELVYYGGLRTNPELTQNSPRDESGQYFQIKIGGLFYFKVSHDYYLLIRNNSSNIAYNFLLYKDKTLPLQFKTKPNSLNPVTLDKPLKLEVSYNVAREMTHADADKLNKENYPEEIKRLMFLASYQNEGRKTFYTKFYTPKKNEHLRGKYDTTPLEQIN